MLIPGWMLRRTVTVETYLGASAYGPRYADPVQVRCLLESKTRTVRDRAGREVVSAATFYARPGAADCRPESRVTLPDGRVTTVIQQHEHNGGGLATPDHLEVHLI
ncbi:hypothetical protein [Streptomyces sp. URMC 129]|uniref:hypothetical protein n=1 Tax=Streptomyces sp. URMC 129 TaxID=3423407 RepID=UPI003F19EEDD